jgi:hypothetical protein
MLLTDQKDYTTMSWKIMAKSTRTGQRVQNHHLDGYRVKTRQEAELEAQYLADQQTKFTGHKWLPVVEHYVNSKGR